MLIILISFFTALVISLIFVIIKNSAAPKKLESVPKLIKQNKLQNAIKLCKQIISKDAKNYLARYYLGLAYLKENRTELALIEFKMVNENALFGEGIEEIPFRKEYAKLLIKYKQTGEALKNYLLLTKQEPTNADNFFQVGTIYEEQNRYDLALGFMQKAAMIDKKHSRAHAEIGLMLFRTKQYGDAKREIDIALKLNPENYTSYYYLGKILKETKNIPEAIKAFEKAQRSQDVKQKAIIEHGSCFLQANRIDNAIVDFQRAVDLDKNDEFPETIFARYFLGICYEKSRKIDKAIEQWEAIFRKNRNFRDVSAKLSEYKDLQSNDFLKDYLTSSNEEFSSICKNVTVNALGLQILSYDAKKWGCQITGVNKGDESWMSVRKQVIMIRFYREPEPVEESEIHQALDIMKSLNSVKSFLFSSSGFTTSAKRYAENRPLELLEKEKLESVLSKAGKK